MCSDIVYTIHLKNKMSTKCRGRGQWCLNGYVTSYWSEDIWFKTLLGCHCWAFRQSPITLSASGDAVSWLDFHFVVMSHVKPSFSKRCTNELIELWCNSCAMWLTLLISQTSLWVKSSQVRLRRQAALQMKKKTWKTTKHLRRQNRVGSHVYSGEMLA